MVALLLAFLGGCSTPSAGFDHRPTSLTSSAAPAAPAAPAEPVVAVRDQQALQQQATSDRDDSIRRQTDQELGADAAAALPPIPAAALREPADPGAVMIVQSIADALKAHSGALPGSPTSISVHELRNLSRASHSEFAEFLQRFASLLTAAGIEHQLTFSADSQFDADFRVLGSAYLVTASGFDQWELFLSISSRDRPFTVWDARAPIRVLRQARPGQPQISSVNQ